MPGGGGPQRLRRRVGTARAAEIILSARSVGADEAMVLGLLQAILPPDSADAALLQWLGRFTAMPRAGLAAKRAIVDGSRLPLTEGLRLEQGLFRDLVAPR